MFSRIVTMRLQPNRVTGFIKTIDDSVLPLLRKQEGFKEAVFFADASGAEAMAITLWDRKENAEAYGNKTYPHVLELLASVVDGTPQVKALNVISSTLHKTAATV